MISWSLTGSSRRKTQQVVSLRRKWKEAGRKPAFCFHSQALQVTRPRKDGEVLHHVGPSQHPETHGVSRSQTFEWLNPEPHPVWSQRSLQGMQLGQILER